MKSRLILVVAAVCAACVCSAIAEDATPRWKMFDRRLGMFVHWGVYSVGAWHEQEQMRRSLPRAEYEKYAQSFTGEKFDADQLVADAKRAGAEYLVFTTKHHDGFCLWDTKTTDYSSVKGAPAKRDFVKELADACRRGGIRLGLYYSNPDWHHPNAYNAKSSHQIKPEAGDRPDMDAYRAYVRAQITELLTNYGEIACLFWDIPPRIDDPEMNALVRRLQPNIWINDRGWTKGEYSTPERGLPSQRVFTNNVEACDSVGAQSWGYRENEDYRTKDYLLRNIDRTLAMGGNFLLNVGPKADGSLPEIARTRLAEVGDWMAKVGAAFRDVEAAPELVADASCFVTRRGDTVYLHYPNGLDANGLNLSPLDRLPVSAKVLNTGAPLTCELVQMPSGFWKRQTDKTLHVRDIPSAAAPGAGVVIELKFADLLKTPVYTGPVAAAEVRARDGVGHFLEKIRAGQKEIVVAYLGGSITAMNGWRNLTTDWLRKTYPGVTFKEVHAAIGGTGSDLGVFRLEHDALRFDPDLLFVEFATNDARAAPEAIWKSMEGIVRQTWRKDATTDIVFAYTITHSMLDDYGRGLFPRAASAMEQLADFYGIPSIGFGPRVMDEVKAGRLVMNWAAAEKATAVPTETPERDKAISAALAKEGKILFAKDGVHPAMPGHEFYLKSIVNGFTQMKDSKPVDHAAKLKATFIEGNLEQAKMSLIRPEMLSGAWRKLAADDEKSKRFSDRMGDIWLAETPGDKLTFKFRGTRCCVYDLLGPDGGQVWITVDGKRAERPRPRFDSYCTYHRIAYLRVFEGADGEHTVEIEVDKDQPSRQSVAFRLEDPAVELAQPKYQGTRFWPAQIMLVGDLVK